MAWLTLFRPFKLIKTYMPKSLYVRVLLILVAPLLLVTAITVYIFLDHHLDSITRRLAEDISVDVTSIVKLYQIGVLEKDEIAIYAKETFNLKVDFMSEYKTKEHLQTPMRIIGAWFLEDALNMHLKAPFQVRIGGNTIIVDVFLNKQIIRFEMDRKRLLSKTTPTYLTWVMGLPILLFIISALFMKNQIRPIKKLAKSADRFGKGLQSPEIKPEGATEVRQAMIAFNRMRERIQRQINQRTEMLAGVSHDLRTPLTRMELQLAMMEETPDIKGLKTDVNEMKGMVESYLAFARGEKEEEAVMANIFDLIEAASEPYRHKIEISERISLRRQVKPQNLRRCFQNLFANADRYATKIKVTAHNQDTSFCIEIDDNGPGIPKDKRLEVFKPFYRLDEARNLDHGGVGLGLAIAQDIVHQHGGMIEIIDSDMGGAKVVITIPA